MAAAYNGLHVVYVPPNVMATLPTAWLHMVHKHKASCAISSSRALSGCIALSTHKELRDLSLDSLRMLLLDDGANPCEWVWCTCACWTLLETIRVWVCACMYIYSVRAGAYARMCICPIMKVLLLKGTWSPWHCGVQLSDN